MSVANDDIANVVKLDDFWIRVLGIPFFGVVIPNVTGLFGNLGYNDFRYWTGYVYFITLSFLIWQGNRFLLFRTRQRFTWFDKPIEKLILLLLNNVFYTLPLTIAWLCLWYWMINLPTNWPAVQVVALINVICVLFVTHAYETIFMVKEQQHELLRNSELQRAKAEAELAALKNQVDPHFMFNSLNSLSHLISVDPAKAILFTENLAQIYRYILIQKDQTLVILEDELAFTSQYADLLRIRFGNALNFVRNFSEEVDKHYLIPPTSVFVALENAVKHNELSEQLPMEVALDIKDQKLIIRNLKRLRRNLRDTSGIGLKNLDDRFRIATGSGITYLTTEDNRFEVTLPLIPLQPT